MKKTIAIVLAALLLLAALAGCGGSGSGSSGGGEKKEVTWADYQQWLIDTFAPSSPDPEGVTALIQGLSSWDDVDMNAQPWAKFFGAEYFGASTWDEFVAAGGVGTYNTEYEDGATSGEPSGEPTGEPSGEMNG